MDEWPAFASKLQEAFSEVCGTFVKVRAAVGCNRRRKLQPKAIQLFLIFGQIELITAQVIFIDRHIYDVIITLGKLGQAFCACGCGCSGGVPRAQYHSS